MKCVCCIFLLSLTSFFAVASQYDVFEENGKVGLKNEQGQVLIPAQYEALGWSDYKFSLIDKVTGFKHNGKWGLISLNNHRITKAEYEELLPGESSLIIARKKSPLSLRLAYGCINTAGKEVIPFQYDGIKISSLRGIVISRTGNQFKYGLIDLTNKVIISISYSFIFPLGSLRYAVENADKKIAIFSDAGKQLTDFTIDSLSVFNKNLAVIYQNQKQGLIDRDGQVKVEAKYREIQIVDEGNLQVRESDEWSFISGQNQIAKSVRADSIVPMTKDLFKVRNANNVRLTNADFQSIDEGPFNHIGNFNKGKAVIAKNNKLGLIRNNGSVLINPLYTNLIWNDQYILASVKPDGKVKWLLLDSLGKQKTPRLYDNIQPFNGIFFPVKNKNHWGAVDITGKEIIACVYDSMIQSKGDHIAVKFRGHYGIIKLNEEWVVAPKPNRSELVDSLRFIERTAKTWFLKTYTGEIIYFSDNRFELAGDHILEYLPSGTVWKIDLQGTISERLAPPEEAVQNIFEETEGLRGIQRDGKYGFVDNKGRLRIANRYDDIQPFSEGLAAIKIRGKWGFLNHQDKIAIQPAYEEVSSFGGGYALVRQKGLSGLIDITGKQVLPARYNDIDVLSTKRLLITLNDQVGLADATGKVLINPKYNHLEDLGNGYVIIERDGKFGLLNLQGISTIPLIYDALTFDHYRDQFIALKKSPWQKLKL